MNMKPLLKDIADRIVSRENKDLGLLSGGIGDTIFLFEYSRFDPRYRDEAEAKFSSILSKVYDTCPHYSYCSGLAGIGLGCLYLSSEGFILGNFEIGEEVDKYLYACLLNCIDQGNYDFLHGAIGIGFYFIERYKQSSNPIIMKALLFLFEKIKASAIAFPQNNSVLYAWRSKNKNGVDVFDISLSHGSSHIILFLCELHDVLDSKYQSDIENLLVGSMGFILSHKIKNTHNSFFPYVVEKDEVFTLQTKGSRLAWCYGDLGVILALMKVHKTLPRLNFYNKARRLALYMTKRRNLSENLVKDSSFCHGASGISAIFAFLYEEFKDKELLNSYLYWLDTTKKMLTKDNLEFAYFNPITDEYEMHEGLLTGVAGVGLALLSYYRTEQPKLPWGKLFLIH